MCTNPHDFLPESTPHTYCINSHTYCITQKWHCCLRQGVDIPRGHRPRCGLKHVFSMHVYTARRLAEVCIKRACILQRFMIQLLGLFVKSTPQKEKRIVLRHHFKHNSQVVTMTPFFHRGLRCHVVASEGVDFIHQVKPAKVDRFPIRSAYVLRRNI